MSSNQQESRVVQVQGRMVWVNHTQGDMFKGKQKVDQSGKALFKDDGSPQIEYGFGLAIPKPGPGASPEAIKNFNDVWNAMHQEAYSLYPNNPKDQNGCPILPPEFAMKYKDGDSFDHKRQQPFSAREGYAGCIVLTCTTTIPIKYYKWQGSWVQVSSGIKAGDYVQVGLGIKGHLPKPGTQGKPGLYLNPNMVAFVAEGKEIINAVDPSTHFGAAAPTIIPGTQIVAPSVPSFGQEFMQNQAPGPQQQITPHHGVLPNQFQQPQMGGMGNQMQPAPQPPTNPGNMGGQPQYQQPTGMPPMHSQPAPQQQWAPHMGNQMQGAPQVPNGMNPNGTTAYPAGNQPQMGYNPAMNAGQPAAQPSMNGMTYPSNAQFPVPGYNGQ